MDVEIVDEVYAFALKNTLNEIQRACPDIKNAFIFKEDGEILAQDETTPEKTFVHVVNAFDGMLERADAIGGVEGITLKGSKNSVNVSRMDSLYLVTVTPRNADMNYVNTLTRVLVPTVLKVLEKIRSAPLKNNPSRPREIEPEPLPAREFEEPATEPEEETVMERPKKFSEPEVTPEPSLPEPPVNQLIIENLGGLLVPSDTVRIDNQIISQWAELYEGKEIEEVDVETFGGKTTRCRVKPIKDSKYEGKGIIQMPEKIQLTLDIRKGELVRVKPVVI